MKVLENRCRHLVFIIVYYPAQKEHGGVFDWLWTEKVVNFKKVTTSVRVLVMKQ